MNGIRKKTDALFFAHEGGGYAMPSLINYLSSVTILLGINVIVVLLGIIIIIGS